MKKMVHIIVKDGLVQEVFAENVDVDVVLYDLDGDDAVELEHDIAIAMLRKTTKKVY
jgi:uncharacterized Rossmann fold enzyme